MNRTELSDALREQGFPEDLYALFGEPRWEAMHIEQVDDRWLVSFWERGIRTSLKTFGTEDEACRYLLDDLTSHPEWKKTWPVQTKADWDRKHRNRAEDE